MSLSSEIFNPSNHSVPGPAPARADGRKPGGARTTGESLSPRARGRKKKSVGTGTNGETHTCKIVDPAPDPTESRIRSAWERLARRARMPREAPEVSRTMSGKGLALPLDLPLPRVNLVFPFMFAGKPKLRVTCGGGGLRRTRRSSWSLTH
jgi:hypothetical protein